MICVSESIFLGVMTVLIFRKLHFQYFSIFEKTLSKSIIHFVLLITGCNALSTIGSDMISSSIYGKYFCATFSN
jgi:hypothetical protein